jgi:hypothetical protein
MFPAKRGHGLLAIFIFITRVSMFTVVPASSGKFKLNHIAHTCRHRWIDQILFTIYCAWMSLIPNLFHLAN